MSNKSKSRKKRQQEMVAFTDALVKMALVANEVRNHLRDISNTVKELKGESLPKLAAGGIVYGPNTVIESGIEVITPFIDKKIYLDDNHQYMFQKD